MSLYNQFLGEPCQKSRLRLTVTDAPDAVTSGYQGRKSAPGYAQDAIARGGTRRRKNQKIKYEGNQIFMPKVVLDSSIYCEVWMEGKYTGPCLFRIIKDKQVYRHD